MTELNAGSPVVIYVIKRRWHTDIGFETGDLHMPLASIRTVRPGAHYLVFGFGDRQYLVNHGVGMGALMGAVWPGPGLILVTALTVPPEQAFGDAGVIRLTLTAVQAQRLEAFIWRSLITNHTGTSVLLPGPYDGSFYFGSTERYSGLHTCNTWTAEGLRAAGLPVHTFGVQFSGQVWRQARRIKARNAAVASRVPG